MPKKKVVIQIAGNPQYAKKTSPAEIILNPATGLPSFGTFPAINLPNAVFIGGPIYLRYGKHDGANRGWGFEHIWQARFSHLPDKITARLDVINLVSSVLVPGAAIYYEFNTIGSAHRRASVFRSSNGVLIVEERPDGANTVFYSVVTAIPSQKVYGQRIGTF